MASVAVIGIAPKLGKNLVEHAKPAPPHEPVVNRLVRPVVARRITSAQSVADHKNDPANHPPVIYSWHSVRQWKIRRNPPHLRLREQNQISHASASPRRQ
jgi:hypothetical protein